MREYFEPLYYQSSFQGAEHHHPQQQQQSSGKATSVKKSHSIVGGGSVSGNVLGRFLKLGKSKSDAQGSSKSRSSTYNIDDLEEDFRLSPSVLNRGPVEKMVHKSNSRKDVSRSHSWIYGSVKLPSDLPFGYGYANGFGSGSPSGSDTNSGGGSPSSGHHTHGVATVSIPRCQMMDYYCSCECGGGDFDFLTAGPGDGSVSGGANNNNGPCKACAYDWAVNGGKKNRKQGSRNSTNSSTPDAGKTFVSSVRKLTWKSLKQAVKKRPSLFNENMKRPNEIRVGVGNTINGGPSQIPFNSPSQVVADVFSNPNGIPVIVGSHGNLLEGSNGYYNNSPSAFSTDELQPNYFFPEKKNIYSSCSDIYRDPPPHVTASVRLRPKPSRQSWQFPNESGPVPNYQEEDLYHSEWDLRQCIPYDVWVSTTSNVKPRTSLPPSKPKTPTPTTPEQISSPSSRNSTLSKSTSVPYLSEIKINQTSANGPKANGVNLKSKSSSSGAVNNNDTISIKSMDLMSKGSAVGSYKQQQQSSSSSSNGIVKRPSILSADVNAYQLLKAQKRNANGAIPNSNKSMISGDDDLNDALSSSSDDLSDNALTSESHMRIAGQKIYMAPNLNGNQSSSSSSTLSNGRSSSSASSTKSSTFSQIQNNKRTTKVRQECLSSDDDDEDGWSDGTLKSQRQQKSQTQNKHVSMNRDQNLPNPPDKANKGFIGTEKEGGNLMNGQQKTQQNQQQYPRSHNGIHGLNNGNYDNCRENNGSRSSFNTTAMENDNTPSPVPNQSSYRDSSTHNNNIKSQRDSNSEENDCVEFEEYIFEDRGSTPADNKSGLAKVITNDSKTSLTMTSKSTTTTMRNPLANPNSQQQRSTGYIKNGQTNNNNNGNNKISQHFPSPSERKSPAVSSNSNSSTNGSSSNSNSKNNGKFGALRRRKSRNGSSNPGKLLGQVIYEEEHEQVEQHEEQHTGISHDEDNNVRRNGNGPFHENTSLSQRSNKSTNEYAVKIIVSHSSGATDYVKPILKNRERVYDTPISNNNINSYKNLSDNATNYSNNSNEIYYDSSLSTASTSKKKVQFNQDKVIVCGGDSGPESDEYTQEEEENTSEEKSYSSNYDNDYEDDNEKIIRGNRKSATSHDDNHKMNGSYYNENNKESGSVSLKSNLSRKSALTDNHNLSQNQSTELMQKTRSKFEEEVVRKAALFALSRQKQAEKAEAASKTAIINANSEEMVLYEECYDTNGSVNNLKNQERLNEDQSRLTTNTSSAITNNMTTYTTTTVPIKRKSNLKSNLKSSLLRNNSQETGSNPDPTQQQVDAHHDDDVSSSPTKQKHFSHNSNNNNKASHGVTSTVMKAHRIANTPVDRSSLNGSSHQQQKIINPNSLLFNDTTRIRLNTRPSLTDTFKLNISKNGQGKSSNNQQIGPTARGVRLKQSNSFKTVGSVALRPKEPPPPPPVALRNGSILSSRSAPRLQKSISTTSLGQLEQGISKSKSSSQIYYNGNRLPTKSEISLPIGLQTTSNQASCVMIKNQNTHAQKDNGNAISNKCKKSSSGFETNGAKTPLGASLNNVDNNNKKQVDANKANGGGSGNRSKSLIDRCEALDKVLGQQNIVKPKANNSSNNKNIGVNNNRNNKHEEIVGKSQPHNNNGEIVKNNSIANGQNVMKLNMRSLPTQSPAEKSKVSNSLAKSTTTTSSSESQSIEIVTKENSVSEIRIYSSGTSNNIGFSSLKNDDDDDDDNKMFESTKTVINNEKNKSYTSNNSNKCNGSNSSTPEIQLHYAATDIFPPSLNERKQFRQPAPLPPIPQQESIVTQSRPQSTSVVLIIDNNNASANNNSNNNSQKNAETAEPSSPLTYSQPIDTLPKKSKALPTPPIVPSTNSSPLASKGKDLSCPNSITYNDASDEESEEPLYDDVINHSQATDLTTKQGGSIGKMSIISSISSRKQTSSRKPLKNLLDASSSQGPTGQIVSSTLPCLACPPSLPPPNLPSKNLSEFHNRPVVLDEDEGERNGGFTELMGNDINIDEEVDNLYNDISDGGSNHGSKSLQSFASSMKGALINAIKSMDFDRRSILSNGSNNSGGSNSTKYDSKSTICGDEDNNFIYDDTLSLRSSTCGGDTARSYYHSNNNATNTSPVNKSSDQVSITRTPCPPPPSSIRSGMSATKPLDNLIEQDEPLSDDADNEPLYDDVLTLPQLKNAKSIDESLNKRLDGSNSSDSGAESEDAIPPPLPAQGPPKISTDLPLITFPLLLNKSSKGSNNGDNFSSNEKVIGILTELPSANMKTLGNGNSSDLSRNSLKKDEMNRKESDVLNRTRSLLNELNEKLSHFNNLSVEASGSSSGTNNGLLPLEFSTYTPNNNKAPISSSSESSGVEEDYNSEKNYSLSNNSDVASASSSSAEENYKLNQVSKLVTETITMARGKFLDSMKTTNSMKAGSMLALNSSNNPMMMLSSNGTSPLSNNNSCGSSPPITEEPIYEEIGDMNRSTSPIYADAFDSKSIFDGASRNEILSFLESIRDRLTTSDSNSSAGSQSSSISSKKGQETERTDSGIGSPSSPVIVTNLTTNLASTSEEDLEDLSAVRNKLVLRKLCPDCNDVPSDNENEMTQDETITPLCRSCNRKRNERKEIITEIHETEMKYGRDLKIISEEFYKPIQIAGLLTKEQLDQIFLNVVELMEISAQLTSMLKADIQSACLERNDEDLTSVNVGKIFLEIGESMMTAFQTYCTRQASAGALLAQLEKEKELLRIFLRVSQMENAVLRRMNLPAFLMVPVQRVTRYPLLLSRLLKVTPLEHICRDELQCAHEKIEQHLEHMNKSTREVASVKLWRRISIINGNSTPIPRRANTDLEGASVSIRKMAIDVLDWTTLPDITCVIDNQLSVFHFNGKPVRGIFGCLLVRGKDLESLALKMDNPMFFPPAEDLVKEVKLVLVKVKNTRFCLLREPLCLSKCVISQGENEFQDFVEINEITTKNTYHLQGMDKQATATWLKYLQCYSMCVGQWRRRRGALANIMMNGMLRHL